MEHTVIRRKGFCPQRSDRAPTKGAVRKLRNPLILTMISFIRNVTSKNLIVKFS